MGIGRSAIGVCIYVGIEHGMDQLFPRELFWHDSESERMTKKIKEN